MGLLSNSGGMSEAQAAEIESANKLEDTTFTTQHGSQGVDNEVYADYMKRNPDLVANYESEWGGVDGGISAEEYGAMHYWEYGKDEGRSLTGGGGGGKPPPKKKPPTDTMPPDWNPPPGTDPDRSGTNQSLGDQNVESMLGYEPISSDGEGGTQNLNPLADANNWLHIEDPKYMTPTYSNPMGGQQQEQSGYNVNGMGTMDYAKTGLLSPEEEALMAAGLLG